MAIAIGDIHGCLNPLQRLVDRLPPDQELVFLGDYVDRGPNSAQVIEYVEALGRQRPCRFLMGNHEALMHDAIEHREDIPLWLFNGGDTTLRSYRLDPREWAYMRERGRPLRRFQRFYDTLRLIHEDEHAIYVHAGINVFNPRLEDQDPQVLLWIRERFFLNAEHWSGKPIVFGHTPTQTMGLGPGRIFQSHRLYGIDTGCVYGGFLTALDTATFERYQEPSDHFRRR